MAAGGGPSCARSPAAAPSPRANARNKRVLSNIDERRQTAAKVRSRAARAAFCPAAPRFFTPRHD
ncbi:hypothetical protein DLM85_10525 [Hymenobacter edaphi]|uniref:Uncharacterized protein n=1 Tax=Hymenobacter edaphi TaxID=2211146 RepID=A0A328BNS2_9BACT|nr:hypothetical protein DLM85_10525 [Hymenobacter edaphi]